MRIRIRPALVAGLLLALGSCSKGAGDQAAVRSTAAELPSPSPSPIPPAGYAIRERLPASLRHLEPDVAAQAGKAYAVVAKGKRWQHKPPPAVVPVCFTVTVHPVPPQLATAIMTVVRQWEVATDPSGQRLVMFSFLDEQGNPRQCAGDEKRMVRVGFNDAQDPWSLIGTDALYSDQSLPGSATLNLPQFLRRYEIDGLAFIQSADFTYPVLHEFGHSLGFKHEFQHEGAKCQWNKERIQQETGWKDEIYKEQLEQVKAGEAYDEPEKFDPHSIMGYNVPASWFTDGANDECYVKEQLTELSDTDRRGVRVAYSQPPSLEQLLASAQAVAPPDAKQLFAVRVQDLAAFRSLTATLSNRR